MSTWKTISILSEIYDKLVELKKKMGLNSYGAVIARLTEIYENNQSSNLEGIVRKAVKEGLEQFFARYKRFRLREETLSRVKKALFGESEELKIGNITVRKGEVFVEDVDDLPVKPEDYGMKVTPEMAEDGEILGYSLVPDIGSDKTLENWWNEHGKLFFELITPRD